MTSLFDYPITVFFLYTSIATNRGEKQICISKTCFQGKKETKKVKKTSQKHFQFKLILFEFPHFLAFFIKRMQERYLIQDFFSLQGKSFEKSFSGKVTFLAQRREKNEDTWKQIGKERGFGVKQVSELQHNNGLSVLKRKISVIVSNL